MPARAPKNKTIATSTSDRRKKRFIAFIFCSRLFLNVAANLNGDSFMFAAIRMENQSRVKLFGFWVVAQFEGNFL
jgi:hypothetical protein